MTLDEAALLAGLPKSPTYYSPITHPDHALKRRNLVINSMLEDGNITAQQAAAARDLPIRLEAAPRSRFAGALFRRRNTPLPGGQVRQRSSPRGRPESLYLADTDLQRAANRAVFEGLAAYERRHGWRGHLQNVLGGEVTLANYQHPDWDSDPEVNGYVHALVTAVTPASATIRFGRYSAMLAPADAAWTRRKLPDILQPGDIAYVKIISLADNKARVTLEEDSGAQGALVAIDNATGEIKAMVGGRDFNLSKFNRATQALRQVGLVLQALRLHRGHRSWRDAGRHHPGCAGNIPDAVRPVHTSPTITTKSLKARSRFVAR